MATKAKTAPKANLNDLTKESLRQLGADLNLQFTSKVTKEEMIKEITSAKKKAEVGGNSVLTPEY